MPLRHFGFRCYMVRIHKRIFALFIVLSFAFCAIPAFATDYTAAAPLTYTISREGNFRFSATDTQIFNLSNVLPGDTWTGTIRVTNNTLKAAGFAVRSCTNTGSDSTLYNLMQMEIRNGATVIYSGSYGFFDSSAYMTDYQNVNAGATISLTVVVSMPATAGNEIIGKSMSSSWQFEARTEDDAAVSVTFDTDGGSAVATQNLTQYQTATRPATDPTKAGNAFCGWYADAGLTTPFNFSTPIMSDTTVYAKWGAVVTHTVTFDTNGGSAVAPVSVVDGTAVLAPVSPTKENHSFSGWYSDAGLTTAYIFTTPVTAPITLYAKWTETPQYHISFNTNGGSPVGDIAVRLGHTATAPANPTRDGFAFDGWYSDAGLTTPFDFAVPVTGDVGLFAKWTAVAASSFLVSFNTNGGSVVADQSVATNGVAVRPANPTKVGYMFVDWYSDAGLTTVYDFTTPVTGALTVYAKWVANNRTVTFDSNGGSPIPAQTVAYGGKAVQPANPTKSGYNFAGWFSNVTLTTLYNFNTVVTDNITLHAKWNAVSYSSGGGGGGGGGSYTHVATPTKYTYTIRYHDVDGHSLAADEKGSAYLGGYLSVDALAINGYTPDASSKSITINSLSNVITFIYTKNHPAAASAETQNPESGVAETETATPSEGTPEAGGAAYGSDPVVAAPTYDVVYVIIDLTDDARAELSAQGYDPSNLTYDEAVILAKAGYVVYSKKVDGSDEMTLFAGASETSGNSSRRENVQTGHDALAGSSTDVAVAGTCGAAIIILGVLATVIWKKDN